ncbi:N-terminal nucleophile aminohydrolase [Pholiota conissans]|uniref:N-terminal nucleophile aminohydrolase n=1 Tax=Pholiota conissans TaxID=109636 RepID=A0A9P6CVU1_9AGAR|nr:N-terminal nucleophile aminohydrolase [Pholiota conissans]
MPVAGYIVVHGGAGTHGRTNEKEVKSAVRKACIEGLSLSQSASADGFDSETCVEGSALSMVERAIVVLENNEHLNAGYGSNLTIDGMVECDASIIARGHSSILFGSVGAVSGVKNPIKLARSILDYSRIPDKLGRIAPLTLVSLGARKFAEERGLEVLPQEALVAPNARNQWKKWKQRLANIHSEEVMNVDDIQTGLRDVQDTVGAVAFHSRDGMAAGVSSGGLLLKHPGRVGEAAVYGAGCWATENMACSLTGTGEHIVREGLARRISEGLSTGTGEEKDPHEILNSVLIDFWESCTKLDEASPSVGVVLLVAAKDEDGVRMWCGFTTASMAVGYASLQNAKPKAVVFRHPNPKGDGRPRIFITSLLL